MSRVALATVVAAISGYLVLLLAARGLGADGYAAFAVFWAAYGLVTGTQNGQLQETTRAVRGARMKDGPAPGARPMPLNAMVGLGLGAVVAVTAIGWATTVFESHRLESVALLSAGVAAFGIYAGLGGALSGLGRWGPFGTLLVVDALIRLTLTVIAVAEGWGLGAFLIITVAGTVSSAVVLLFLRPARAALGVRGDVATRELARNTFTAMSAALASAILVMGFPVLIKLSTSGALDSAAGAVILAVTLTRAPLLVPLNSFQGALISRFVENRERLLNALTVPLGIVIGVGAVGSVAAWLLGPWLLENIFGGDYRLSGTTVAALTAGAVAMAALTLTGAMALAAGRHRLYATGWWVGTAVSIGLLFIPADLEVRVPLALIVGPLVGMSVHLVAAARPGSAHEVPSQLPGDRPLPAE
ncbi:MAG: polysaccharide biosynthesis protein [Gordonia sp.]|uniref:lipopolysaccharide biosynthesis protein n=1 Tax=Williamsia sp. 1138 TaxID=1903117 RepID=UPI000A12268B|nr:polysaccharide biosynthesis protein [Williamsia sp. 1138]MBA4023292.1 polysaccharide biosynthesis protein [Gordonia sp. (in: high G+C Gram-positive bacteria)]OZG26245.1 polysaccharide biosynthesis protein [Williamsia sp. 1138]